jgi:hypothetical protein
MSNLSKKSFVILLEYSDYFEDEVLKPLNLSIVIEESDIALGYYTVIGTHQPITELESYLKGTNYL